MDNRLKYLFERCMNASASPEEQKEFIQLLQLPKNEYISKKLLERAFKEPINLVDISDETANHILQAIFDADVPQRTAIIAPIEIPAKNRSEIFKKWWMVAASVILLLVGFGLYVQYGMKKGQNLVANESGRYKNDVPPGAYKAVLTLTNGQQITLDSASNIALPLQGSSKVQKLTGGKLAYQVTKTTGSEITYNTLSTPRGGQYELTLPDGTNVWLNAASSIIYPTAFNGKNRTVILSGEAYFEVKHLTNKPFIVNVGGKEIEDLGTHFNISAYTDEPGIKTTLLEGSVKVGSTVLKPGEEAILNTQGQVQVIDDPDIDKIIAWKNNLFIFSKDDLETIMRQLSRWYAVEVVYQGKSADWHFSGIISRNNNISEVLKMLELTEKVKFQVDGSKITVMP